MNLIALDLPENHDDWPNWLEGQLVSPHLGRLIEQLHAIQGATSKPSIELNQWLGSSREQLLTHGLHSLESKQVVQLVQQPSLLLDLQELVLSEGLDYWQKIPRPPGDRQKVETEWTQIAAIIAPVPPSLDALVEKRSSATVSLEPSVSTSVDPKESSTNRSRRRSFLIGLAALAATGIVAVVTLNQTQDQGLFFDRAGLLTSNREGKEFLSMLAKTIQSDWNTKPSDGPALQRQLTLIRNSCDTLLASNLRQIPNEIQVELKKRCKLWRDKFDGNINDLEAGKNFDDVLSDANATVERLQKVLSELIA